MGTGIPAAAVLPAGSALGLGRWRCSNSLPPPRPAAQRLRTPPCWKGAARQVLGHKPKKSGKWLNSGGSWWQWRPWFCLLACVWLCNNRGNPAPETPVSPGTEVIVMMINFNPVCPLERWVPSHRPEGADPRYHKGMPRPAPKGKKWGHRADVGLGGGRGPWAWPCSSSGQSWPVKTHLIKWGEGNGFPLPVLLCP